MAYSLCRITALYNTSRCYESSCVCNSSTAVSHNVNLRALYGFAYVIYGCKFLKSL